MAKHSFDNLPDINLSEPSRFNLKVRPDIRAYLASVAAGNNTSETQVLHIALGILRNLGQAGIREAIEIPSTLEGVSSTIILLGLDPSRAAFSVEEYEHLRAEQDPA